MKTKLATILVVVMLVAIGVLYESHTKAINAKTSPTFPELNSKGDMTPVAIPLSAQVNNAWDKNYGRIVRIYPDPDRVLFRFGGVKKEVQTAMNPTDGYYSIPKNHPNYQALVDLLYLAAANDWKLNARTQPQLIGGFAEVVYLVKDFKRE